MAKSATKEPRRLRLLGSARLQFDGLLGMAVVDTRASHTTRRPGTRAGSRPPDWSIENVAVHAEAAADHLDAQRLARDPAVDLLHRGALRELCGRDGSAPRRIDFHRSASELFASTDAQLNRRASSRDRDAAARARCTSALAVSCCAHLDPPGARYGIASLALAIYNLASLIIASFERSHLKLQRLSLLA